jgi:hypothetical protein
LSHIPRPYDCFLERIIIRGWGCSSMVEHLSSMCEALGLIPSPVGKKKSHSLLQIHNEIYGRNSRIWGFTSK